MAGPLFLVVNKLHCPPTTSFCWESLPQPPEALHQVLHGKASLLVYHLCTFQCTFPCSQECKRSHDCAQVETRQAAQQMMSLKSCGGAARHARQGLPDIPQPHKLSTGIAAYMVSKQSMGPVKWVHISLLFPDPVLAK